MRFKTTDVFFKPWIGRLYKKGVLQTCFGRGMKLLVIGASRYCEYLVEHGETACPYQKACCFTYDSDRLIQIAGECPFVNDSEPRKDTHKDFTLRDINTASILKAYYGQAPRAYRKFQIAIRDILGCDDPRKVWLHLAFVNYFQPIIWNEGKKRTRTPRVSDYKEAYEESKRVIKKVIKELAPDVILVWQSSRIRNAFDSLFPDAEPTGRMLRTESNEDSYPSYYLNVNGHKSLIQTVPHPTGNHDFGALIKSFLASISQDCIGVASEPAGDDRKAQNLVKMKKES